MWSNNFVYMFVKRGYQTENTAMKCAIPLSQNRFGVQIGSKKSWMVKSITNIRSKP